MTATEGQRPSGRTPDELRQVSFETRFTRHAAGSVLAVSGDTRVLCTASVENGVPRFLRGTGQGWVTAEYGMLPGSTHTRSRREASQGRQSGRTLEIQRLIGRSLRAVVNLAALGERTCTLDCDVLQADGGTRTAAISGAYVALDLAFRSLEKSGQIDASPLHGQIAAVSVGIYKGVPVLDLSRLRGRFGSRNRHECRHERFRCVRRNSGHSGRSCVPTGGARRAARPRGFRNPAHHGCTDGRTRCRLSDANGFPGRS